MSNFSKDQEKEIENLMEWIVLLKEDPFYTNRLKIWARLKSDGAVGWLLIEAFKRSNLLNI